MVYGRHVRAVCGKLHALDASPVTLYVYRCPGCDGPGVRLAVAIVPVPACTDHGSMELLTDSAMAVLPLETAPSIGPLKVETLHAAGITVPETQHALEWLYRHRATNGMAGAFLLIGGRRCIDLVAFAKLSRERRA